jgi:hypothetical protein
MREREEKKLCNPIGHVCKPERAMFPEDEGSQRSACVSKDI